MTVVLVFLAGGAGSVARYLVGLAGKRLLAPDFPFGTLTVNIIGCFLIALVLSSASEGLSPQARVVLSVGFLGGFTTFSSFNYDTLRFVQEGAIGKAAAYFVATTVGCAMAGLLGNWLTRGQ